MELEAAVIGVSLLQLIQRQMTLTFSQIFLWSDGQVVLDWIASKKKQKTEIFLAQAIASNLYLSQSCRSRHSRS